MSGETDPQRSLIAKSALNEVGSVSDLRGVCAKAAMHVIHNGTVSSGVVTLQGSLDGISWVDLQASGALAGAGPTAVYSIDKPTAYLRSKITTVIGGGGTVTTWVAGAEY